MKGQILGALKYVLYPLFYVVALIGCLYITFPWDALKHRIENEFAKAQASKGDRAWRLSIAELDGYWLSGVEMSGAKIIMPPENEEDEPTKGLASTRVGAAAPRIGPLAKKEAEKKEGVESADDKAKDEKKAPKDTVVLIEEAHGRVRLLPLIIGRVKIDFSATVFGGEVHGVVPIGGGDLEVEIESVDLAQIMPLRDVTGVPLKGLASGKLALSAPSGKWSKSTGSLNLTISGMVMGDGKTKFRDLIALPPANIGTFELIAKADSGLLKIEKFGAVGQDVELTGEGTVKLKEPWDGSVADLWMRFGFSEEYKNKDERTQALFIDDGPFPALISQDKKMKRAKRPDGLWGFHVHGKFSRLRYDATSADGPKAGSKAGTTGDSPLTKKKKAAKDEEEEDEVGKPAAKERPNRVMPKRTALPDKKDAEEPSNDPQPAEPTEPENAEQPDPSPEPAPAPEEEAPQQVDGPEPAPDAQ